MATQVQIARRVGLDVSSVNKILNRRQGPVFRKEPIKKVFKIARQMGYDFGRLKYQHRRRHARKPVTIGAELSIYKKDGTLFDQGMTTIRDISLCGARISDVMLPRASLPVDPFTIHLRPMQKPLDNVELPGRIVRMDQDTTPSFGVNFGNLNSATQKTVSRLVNA